MYKLWQRLMLEKRVEKNNLPVALFDSGVGGLTVVRALQSLLPGESLLYLGDTARVPYGTRSRETIVRYTLNAAAKLLEYGAKMLVIACNTATAAALPVLRENFAGLPVIGVIEPGAEAALLASRNNRIVVIGTEATIRGQAYQNAIRTKNPNAKVIAVPCSLFVALAEEGWASDPVAEEVGRRYLASAFPPNTPPASLPDTLLLGCTHFPLFEDVLRRITGGGVSIVDSARATARVVKKELERRNILATAKAKRHFLTTDNKERFIKSGSLFMGRELQSEEVELVDL